ncbi:DUF4199 domain-containing protein [Parvularcula sp. ZS-1/3]|uniref:DUF4199 domain-containing protein n=1 Tax=Parvularcula mediterranea TaxID=2732508 RepID=A0A7Y3W612_9PROT|nr:DUF4199 domain-containing protein [Parvularcula mediterranea]NNU17199.1 DUF4199 domain-containing protein [Parvularcula mediterranea]
MIKTAAIYGAIAGAIIIIVNTLSLSLAGGENADMAGLEWLGYLVMLLALSVIFFAIKRYRDVAQGGVITFWTGLSLGLLISAFAGVAYVLVWEVYIATTGSSFIDSYTASVVEKAADGGATASEIEALKAKMATMAEQYANPLFRIPVTFLELFPVGLVISLISAALLRNSKFLQASQ